MHLIMLIPWTRWEKKKKLLWPPSLHDPLIRFLPILKFPLPPFAVARPWSNVAVGQGEEEKSSTETLIHVLFTTCLPTYGTPPYLSINLHNHDQHYMCGHREPPRQEGGHISSPFLRSCVLVKAGSNERSFLGPRSVKRLILLDRFLSNFVVSISSQPFDKGAL